MNTYSVAVQYADRMFPIGSRVREIVVSGPDDVNGTLQEATVESHEIVKDQSGFYVSAILLHCRLDDGRKVVMQEV